MIGIDTDSLQHCWSDDRNSSWPEVLTWLSVWSNLPMVWLLPLPPNYLLLQQNPEWFNHWKEVERPLAMKILMWKR